MTAAGNERRRDAFLNRWTAFGLPADDLLRDPVYRRLWTSTLLSAFGAQITLLALPLTAAVLLHATPTQMGHLTAMELAPFALFSLPAGVWLDRRRKLPVYVAGESLLAVAVASVPLGWWLGWLHMAWLLTVAFLIGAVNTLSGTAGQIVLTQVVARERLVAAHAKNALAQSGAEIAGPGAAGALIRLFTAPLALWADAALLLLSAGILRGLPVHEVRLRVAGQRFWHDMAAGLRFVRGNPLLVALAWAVGGWQFCNQGAVVVQILYATRSLGMSEPAVGLAYMGLGAGTVIASAVGARVSRRIGPGPCLALGIACTGAGWTALALAPGGAVGIAVFVAMLLCYAAGGMLLLINFLALRQAVTPEPLLGRMTSTMRWLSLLPAVPGALCGGWIGEHVGLRAALGVAGGLALLLAACAWWHPVLRAVRTLPTVDATDDWLGV